MKGVTPYQTDMDIQKRAFRILLREMGLAETLRFNMGYERGSGDYAKERSRYFRDTAVDVVDRPKGATHDRAKGATWEWPF